MSYLNALRLHFAGQFQANVSTVNNDPAHFDNAAFQPGYQTMEGPHMQPPNGWFNPQGDAAFRLLGCGITSAWMQSGRVPASDPVLGFIVADSDQSVPAKLVDLDSEQQLVSEIWGLQVRIADTGGNTLMRGDFEAAAFMDIWDRATKQGAGGDTDAGAMYQSILSNLYWADVAVSPFLVALKQASIDGVLSIKFNVDGLNMNFAAPDFMCGRIVGTIGPATLDEPRHLVLGRQFMAAAAPPSNSINFFWPKGGINFCVAVVDSASRSLFLDLGNALPTGAPGRSLNNLGDLTVGVYTRAPTPTDPAGAVAPLGVIPAQGADGYVHDPLWYARTAGVVALPLSAAQLQLVQNSPLHISGDANIQISESSSGAFVRADRFVYRLSAGEKVEIPVYAMQWGRSLAGAAVSFALDPSQLQQTPNTFPFAGAGPPVAVPADVLTYTPTGTALSATSPVVASDGSGVAVLPLTAGDPDKVRWFNNGADYGIDGQVYGVRPAFADPGLGVGPVNQWNFISFLVWSGFEASNPVTWTDVQPIFQQYGNLYPVMSRFLDLTDELSVKAHAHLLLLAFGLREQDPNAMPVTRDLSPAKRAAILAWLMNPAPGAVASAQATARTARAAPPAAAGASPPRGGKAAAAARRLALLTP
jgi:hypothetical protein